MREVVKAQSLIDALNADGVFIAGATEAMRLKSSIGKDTPFIDILPLLSSKIEEDGDDIIIGAAATFSSLIESPIIPPFLKEAASFMASSILRNASTIGGNIANKRDDSFLIPSLASVNAKLSIETQNGAATISMKDYLSYESRAIIKAVIIKKNSNAKLFRESLTSHSHSILSLAKGDVYCFAVKGSGIFFDSNIPLKNDLYSSKEYKEYLISLFIEENGGIDG